jgi:aryl-alcohol dehydrogenase-like predicted oxidoreductase
MSTPRARSAWLLPQLIHAYHAKELKMEYRSLGRTAIKVSPLCLGCMMFGGKTTPEDSYAIIDRALDAGINFLDTANVYSRGRSEEVTGEALKRNGKRHAVVLATKVHGTMDDHDPNAYGSSRRHIIEQCEASLRRLQTDYIDLYQIHRPRSDTPIDETLRALDDLVRAGKVRYIGTSTFGAWQLVESLWVAKEYGLNRFVCEQPPYHILDRRIERELIPMAQTYGFGIIPWSPLAGGLLTGKYTREHPSPEGGRYSDANMNPRFAARKTAEVYDVVEELTPVAAARGITLAQFALAWCMHQPGVTSPIIGPRTMAQLEDNLGALTVTISAEDRAAVDRLVPPGRMVSPFYEADFGPHQFRW